MKLQTLSTPVSESTRTYRIPMRKTNDRARTSVWALCF